MHLASKIKAFCNKDSRFLENPEVQKLMLRGACPDTDSNIICVTHGVIILPLIPSNQGYLAVGTSDIQIKDCDEVFRNKALLKQQCVERRGANLHCEVATEVVNYTLDNKSPLYVKRFDPYGY